MESFAVFGGAQVAIMLMLFGGVGLPLGAPPEKPVPAMAHVAPDDCLLYVGWAGMAKADPASENHTERLLAEPEVQQFAAALERALGGVLKQIAERSEDKEALLLAEMAPLWTRTILTRPGALYVTRFEPQGKAVLLEGGLIVQAGDAALKLDESLTQLMAAGGKTAAEVSLGGRKFRKLAADPQAVPFDILWGSTNGYLMIGFGTDSLEKMLARLKAMQQPQWLTKLHEQLPIERRSTVSYLNVKKLVDTFAPLAGPEAERLLASLGLRQIKTFQSSTGLNETGIISRSLLTYDGPPRGLLSLLSSDGIAKTDLAHIPADALFATCLSLDVRKILDEVVATASEADPRAGAVIEEILRELKEEMDIDVREAASALGNNWSLHAATADGGFMGTTLVLEVADRTKAAAVEEKVIAILNDPNPGPSDFGHGESKVMGQTIHYAVPRGDVIPLQPAWCLTEKQLIVGLYPQSVKAVLMRKSDQRSLADVPEVARHFSGEKPPLSLTYFDSRKMFEATYGYAQMFVPMMLGKARREGAQIDFDPALLPSMRTISRHLQPSVCVWRQTPRGLEMETRQTLPVANVGASTPVAVALLLPAVRLASVAAQRTQSSNNLKQQMIAMHNFHDSRNRFPAAYSADSKGRPLLSWRVHLLPMMDQKELYGEFRLDEPWDSEHNKKLISKMPAVYRSPESKAAEGMTTYLGVGGERGVLIKPTGGDPKTAAEGTRLSAITDGVSHTIAIVEASDELAVIWTKPEGWEPDANDPLKGLVGLRPDGFLAAFADAHVRLIPKTTPKQTLKAIFTRDGGETEQLPRE